MLRIKDVYIRHKVCLLFLKYGFTPETLVKQGVTMIDFLCNLRNRMKSRKSKIEKRNILMETLCLTFFFFKNDTSVLPIIGRFSNDRDRKQLEDSFINQETGKFSTRHIDCINLIKKITIVPIFCN